MCSEKHVQMCTISMIYELGRFALQLHMKVIPVQWKDDWGWTPFLVIFFFFFHASDSSENVPVHHSCACGAVVGGIRGGEIMRAHTGCKEFRDSYSVGALPLYPPSSLPPCPPILILQRSGDTALTTGTRPPVTTDSQSGRGRGGAIAPWQPFGYLAQRNREPRNFKEPGWALSTRSKSHCLRPSVCLGAQCNIRWHLKQRSPIISTIGFWLGWALKVQ